LITVDGISDIMGDMDVSILYIYLVMYKYIYQFGIEIKIMLTNCLLCRRLSIYAYSLRNYLVFVYNLNCFARKSFIAKYNLECQLTICIFMSIMR